MNFIVGLTNHEINVRLTIAFFPEFPKYIVNLTTIPIIDLYDLISDKLKSTCLYDLICEDYKEFTESNNWENLETRTACEYILKCYYDYKEIL